jgi:hypothetical protein
LQITLNLPHVFFPGARTVENAQALRILLDCLINLNRVFLRSHAAPTLYKSGVRYGRTRLWEPIPALYRRQYGDCKSLSAALIAEYREKGEHAEPAFRWIKNSEGGTDFHILVHTTRGFEDPSKRLGMGSNENAHFIQIPID